MIGLRSALLSSFALSAHADVLVVDASGGGAHTEIAAAVAAAVDGDTILVQSGAYEAFTITSDLRVMADVDAEVFVQGAVRIDGVPAGKSVWLSGLRVEGREEEGLIAQSSGASVRVQDCAFTGSEGADAPVFGSHIAGWDGARVVGCPDVVFVGCTLTGGTGTNVSDPFNCCNPGDVGGAGLTAEGSTVAVYDSILTGGEGGTGDVSGGDGGHGCALSGTSQLFVTGGTLRGGDGGDADDFIPPTPPGDGGDGLFVDAGSQATVRDVELVGGAGGFAFVFGIFGDPGVPSGGGGGTAILTAHAWSLGAPSPVRENSSFVVTVEALPGSFQLLGVAPGTFSVLLPILSGVLHIDTSAQYFVLGLVPPSGVIEFPASLGSLGASLQAAPVYLQGLGVNTLGAALLTSPAHLLVLDSAF